MLYSVLAARSPVRKRIVLLGASLCTLPFLVNVCQAQSLVATPSSLNFSQVADAGQPAAQAVQVTASDGSHIPFTVPPSEWSNGQNVWNFYRQPH